MQTKNFNRSDEDSIFWVNLFSLFLRKIYLIFLVQFIIRLTLPDIVDHNKKLAQSARAVEYVDFISAGE